MEKSHMNKAEAKENEPPTLLSLTAAIAGAQAAGLPLVLTKEIAVGDVVYLKGQFVRLSVIEVNAETVKVTWYDHTGTAREKVYPREALGEEPGVFPLDSFSGAWVEQAGAFLVYSRDAHGNYRHALASERAILAAKLLKTVKPSERLSAVR